MRSFQVLLIRAYRAVDAFGPSGFRLSQMLVIEVEVFHAKTRRLNPAGSMQLPARYQVSMRSGCARDCTGTYRPNHVITEQEAPNEGIALQIGHDLRDVRWAEDPSKVSTNCPDLETIGLCLQGAATEPNCVARTVQQSAVALVSCKA